METKKINLKSKSQFDLPSFIGIDEVFVTYKYKNEVFKNKQVSKLSEKRYLSALMGVNDVEKPSFKDGQIYYTLIDDKLTLLPEATSTDYYTKVSVLYQQDFDKFSLDTDLPLTREFKDLLINLAAIEAMTDIARTDKVNLLRYEANDNFRLLGAYATDRKNREGVPE